MPDDTRHVPTLLEPLDLKSAGAAFCCRFGEAAAEAQRLMVLREVLSSSRELSRVLDEFTKSATTHYRGVHCTADMHVEMEKISRALMQWSESMVEAGSAYRDWQERHASHRVPADVQVAPSLLSFDAFPIVSRLSDASSLPPA